MLYFDITQASAVFWYRTSKCIFDMAWLWCQRWRHSVGFLHRVGFRMYLVLWMTTMTSRWRRDNSFCFLFLFCFYTQWVSVRSAILLSVEDRMTSWWPSDNSCMFFYIAGFCPEWRTLSFRWPQWVTMTQWKIVYVSTQIGFLSGVPCLVLWMTPVT